MARFRQPEGQRGSLKWTQRLVNDHRDLLEGSLRPVLPLPRDDTLTWLSPLKADDYAEYRDEAFLERLGIRLTSRPLPSFWPRGGPQWDALACSRSGKVVLVEAKAHVAEVFSPPTRAREPSLSQIRSALAETARFFRASPGTDWSAKFYQYTNRLAHIYLLRELNDIDAHLIFLYFVGDAEMNGPSSQAEWAAAIQVLHEALGIRGRVPSTHVHDVFIDMAALR